MGAVDRYEFLKARAEGPEDVRTIERIVEQRRSLMRGSSPKTAGEKARSGGRTYLHGAEEPHEEPLRLRIFGLDLLLSPSLAPSSIDTLVEVFRDRAHMRFPGFSGEELSAAPGDVPTLLDIGANEGFYSLAMQQANPHLRIFAVEPNPQVYALLTENCRRNGNGIRPIHTAVTDTSGTIELETYPHLSTMSSRRIEEMEQSWMDVRRIRRIQVPAVSLDQLMREEEIGRVDLLKIDVEGEEEALIEGARNPCGESDKRHSCSCLQRVDRLVLEWHSEELKERCISQLGSEGFELLHEEPHRFGDLYFGRP